MVVALPTCVQSRKFPPYVPIRGIVTLVLALIKKGMEAEVEVEGEVWGE